jgi:hypothetical protein
MEWNDVHDPAGEFDFNMEWTLVSGEYVPDEIQKMINETGVQGMVHTVNEHFKLNVHGHSAMHLVNDGGKKKVIQA